jgi:hypothetical protein
VSLPLKGRPEQARGVSLQLLKLLHRRALLEYPEIETWIDLGPNGKARLIATTLKSAKGESVCSKFSTLGAFGPRVFSFGPIRRMLEDSMSVWSAVVTAPLPLWGAEGALVSVSISVEPPRLEALLDALAHLDFPVNPQIYHDAGPAAHPRAIVEFPAYEQRLPEIRGLLETCGFPAKSLTANAMLDSIRSGHPATAVA